MRKEEVLQTLTSLKDEARQRYKAEIKGVFGSYARGEEKEESDIDVLADFEKGADLFDFVGLGLFLEEKLNCKVDVVPQRSIRKEIKANVLRETIYL